MTIKKEDIQPIIDTAKKIIYDGAIDIIKDISNNIKALNEDDLKRAQNHQETTVDEHNMSSSIKWIKEHFPKEVASGACITRDVNLKGDGFIIHHNFLDKENNPMIGSEYPTLVVNTKSLSEDIRSQFGNKDMIIIR